MARRGRATPTGRSAAPHSSGPATNSCCTTASHGGFDIVVAEALDRISRDQADTATFYKHLILPRHRARDARRGPHRRTACRSQGHDERALPQGPRASRRDAAWRDECARDGPQAVSATATQVVRELASDGRPVVGKRAIVPEEALIVQRIFSEFANGESPASDCDTSQSRREARGRVAKAGACPPSTGIGDAEPAS